MTRADGQDPTPRYMTLGAVARELGLKSPGSVRNKIYDGQLVGVNVATRGRSQLRVTRDSFLAYCERIEAEAAERFNSKSA